MNKFLFDEFPTVSAKQWKQKIQFDLKGENYNNTLLTNTNEGIRIKPFYHKDDYKKLDVPKSETSFKICQSIFVNDEKVANFLAKDALKRGADSIKFIANKTFDFKLLLHELLADRDENLDIIFEFQFLKEDFIINLIEFGQNQRIYLSIDLIGNLVQTGKWYYSNQEDHKILKTLLKRANRETGILDVDVSHYQNSGANIIQQLAYALAHANEYLNFIFQLKVHDELKDSEIENIVKNIQFTFAIGGNYFFEIAKFRAFKILWKLLLKEYDLDFNSNVFAVPSSRNKTIYDQNVNMLRTTTECMSAILGGADTINNIAYNSVIHKKNEFGERLSRNQLIILREESNITNADFAEGSYYIEELTAEMSEKALILFKDIERSGGFVKQLFEGTIQRKIDENAQKEQAQFDESQIVLVGTNKYPNKEDHMQKDIKIYPFLRTSNRETLIKPILAKRLAEKWEKKRIDAEKMN